MSQPTPPAKHPSPNRWLVAGGAISLALGLFFSVLATTGVVGFGSNGIWLICLGLALFLSGVAVVSVALWSWSDDWADSPFDPELGVTFGALATMLVIAAWAAEAPILLLLAISAGAVGGVVHEVAQSNGSIAFPGSRPPKTSGSGQGNPGPGAPQASPAAPAAPAPPAAAPPAGAAAPAAPSALAAPPAAAAPGAPPAAGAPAVTPPAPGTPPGGTDNAPGSEFYLGSLAGLVLGGVAGLLIYSATSQSALALGISAFTAGLALKGVSEAVSTAATH